MKDREMTKERVYTGYAVVTKDILDDKVYKNGAFGISFTDRSLETCKRWCNGNHIVVRTYRTVIARSISFRWVSKYPCFKIPKRHWIPCILQLGFLQIVFEKSYGDEYEREIVYEK